MNKFIRISSVKPGYQMLHDGKLQLVERVDNDDPLYTTIVLPDTIVQRPSSGYLAGVQIPRKPRSKPACPPLTARLSPEDRAWTLWFAEQSGRAPQEVLAIALQMYHHEIDHLQARAMAETLVQLPARKPHQRRWWGRRKKAA